MLEVMSLEVPAESVGTVAGVQSWKQRVPDFRDATEKLVYTSSVLLLIGTMSTGGTSGQL